MESYKPSKLVKQKIKTNSNEKRKPCSAPKRAKPKSPKTKYQQIVEHLQNRTFV